MSDYKDKLGGLANKLKTEKPKTPIQEVTPVKDIVEQKESVAQLNVWIPKELLKKMKRVGVEKDLSLKEITIKALNVYLEMSENK